MLTGLAHSAICVTDLDAAVAWYRDVLGLRVLSPPFRIAGADIERDMAEVVPEVQPVVLKAAIVGFDDRSDRVLEVIEYPGAPLHPKTDQPLSYPGLTHVGVVCDDIVATRRDLEAKGAEFITAGVAGIAGLRTTWMRDPFGIVWILMQKGNADRPYYRQHA
jgi:catechol 2,3-dioxygenase-like lactoylglutathione lyase family enzyme